MLNMKTKAVAETGTLELLDADDEELLDAETGNRASITLHGPGSKVYEKADNERQNTLLTIIQGKGGKAKVSSEQQRQMDATFYARVTSSFNNWTHRDDNAPASGFDDFKEAYLDSSIGFIPAQVRTYLGDWGNFKKGSAKI